MAGAGSLEGDWVAGWQRDIAAIVSGALAVTWSEALHELGSITRA